MRILTGFAAPEFAGRWVVQAMGWTLLHFVWEGALVAVLLWCALELMDRRRVQARYAAACCALGLMVLLPVATLVHVGMAEHRLAVELRNAPVEIGPGMVIEAGMGGPSAPWRERMAGAVDRSAPWILLAWFAGAMVFLGRLQMGFLVARRMRWMGTAAAPDGLLEVFERLRERLGVGRAVRLMQSALVEAPTVIGWLKPVVLVPVSCLTGLSAMQVEAILCHELAHIRRHDYLVSVVQSVVEALLFYHPAVWWVSRQVRRERECCCDELAVEMGGDRLGYARALSWLEERRSLSPAMVLGANGGVLTMRIKRVLGVREGSAASQVAAGVVLAVMVLAGGAMVGELAHAQTSDAAKASSQGAEAGSTAAAKAERDDAVSDSAARSLSERVRRSVREEALSPEEQRQIEEARQRLAKKIDTPEFRRRVADAAATIDSPEFQRQMADVIRASKANTPEMQRQLAATLNSPEFKKQLADVRKTMWVVNTPEFRRQTDEAMKAANAQTADSQRQLTVTLNSPEFKKQIAAAIAGAAKMNTPEFRKELDDAMRAVQRADTQEFRSKMGQLLAESAAQEPLPSPGASASPSAAAKPMQVKGGVMQGNLISDVNPLYPAAAKKAHVQGVVVLKAIISKTGDVKDLQVVSGPKELVESAVEAVNQWKYKPYLLNGQPTEVETTINVHYTFGGNWAGAPPPSAAASAGRAKGPLPIRVSSGMMAGQLISKVDPVYPPDAKMAGVQGAVVLKAMIAKDGTVEDVQVVSGPKELMASAVDAVRQWVYKPYLLNGEPVEVQTTITVNYSLEGGKAKGGKGESGDAVGAPKEIGGAVSAPVLVYSVEPEMTKEARKAKKGGVAIVGFWVDTNGLPTHVHVVKEAGYGLDEQAVKAVEQYRFKPAMEDGRPVTVALNVEVNFKFF